MYTFYMLSLDKTLRAKNGKTKYDSMKVRRLFHYLDRGTELRESNQYVKQMKGDQLCAVAVPQRLRSFQGDC